MITLSTAESDGTIAMKGIEAILGNPGETIEQKIIASDSTAALSISSGASSWRTRHLKIKANWLNEQLEYGMFKAIHCPGERRLADLLTQALTMPGRVCCWDYGEYVIAVRGLQQRLRQHKCQQR